MAEYKFLTQRMKAFIETSVINSDREHDMVDVTFIDKDISVVHIVYGHTLKHRGYISVSVVYYDDRMRANFSKDGASIDREAELFAGEIYQRIHNDENRN